MTLETGLSGDRLGNLLAYSSRCRWLPGAFAEFGVYKGGSLEMLSDFNPDRKIYGIDGFEGLPAPGKQDTHVKGEFDVPASDYLKLMKIFNKRQNVTILKGYSPEILESLDSVQFAFVHVDVDLYQSVKDALDFFYPRLSPDGMMLFDDYGFPTTPGAKIAVDEWRGSCKWRGELVFADGGKSGQYLIIK